MVNDHRHSGTLVTALKLVRKHLPPECRAIPSGSTMRRIKGRSTTHLTPQDLYDVAILAKPKHHKAVAETLRAVGIDLAIVNQYDIACAAEIHAREGAPPGEAFQAERGQRLTAGSARGLFICADCPATGPDAR